VEQPVRSFAPASAKLVRGGAAKTGPLQREGVPWRAKAQESYVLRPGLNNRTEVADSRVEQTPEGGKAAEAAPYACQT
jgi:hypothetical protein